MTVTVECAFGRPPTVRLQNPLLRDGTLKISLFNRTNRQYLTPGGWSGSRRTLLETSAQDGIATFEIPLPAGELVNGGDHLTFEEIFVGYQDDLTWPAIVIPPEPPAPHPPTPASPQGGAAEAGLTMPDRPGPGPRPTFVGVAPGRFYIALSLILGFLAGGTVAYGISAVWGPNSLAVRQQLGQLDADLGKRRQQLTLSEQQLATAAEAMHRREASVVARETTLAETEREAIVARSAASRRDQTLDDREAAVTASQQQLAAISKALDLREASVAARETVFRTEQEAAAVPQSDPAQSRAAAALRAQVTQLTSQLAETARQLEEAKGMQAGSLSKNADLRNLNADLRRRAAELTAALASAKETSQPVQAAAPAPEATPAEALSAGPDSAPVQIVTLTGQLEAAKRDLAAATSAKDRLTSDNQALLADSADLQRQLADLNARSRQDAQTMADLTVSVSAFKQNFERVSQELNILKLNPTATERAVWGAAALSRQGTVYALQNQVDDNVGRDVKALCEGRSKGPCEQLTVYSNACITVARAGGGVSTSNFRIRKGPDWATSRDAAMQACNENFGDSCRIAFTACSPDRLAQSGD